MGVDFKFDQPTCYRIQIKGKLDPKWSDWFDGFTISYTNSDTVLTGMVADQAALHGVIAKIRDLGLPIRSVQSQEDEESRS
jgi:hypothetical protein